MRKGLGKFPDLRSPPWAWQKRDGGVFEGGVDTLMHIMGCFYNVLTPYDIACVFAIFHHELMIR